MEGINGLKAEVMQSRADIGFTEEEYWEAINGLAINSLASSGQPLEELREYYNTHDETILGDEAENIILHWFGLLR